MKKIILISIVFIGIAAYFNSQSISYPEGAPAGVTGSPADKKTCTKCHDGFSATKNGWIKSNIDSTTGYKPGATYTITATSTGMASTKRFGFEISPQNQTGSLLGKLVVTNLTETQLVGNGKYITHKEEGTIASNSKSWKFNWVAPLAGTGDVTFYGAFVLGPPPFAIVTSKLKVKEAK